MVFHQRSCFGILGFGFVSGHDFSRAAQMKRELGFSPCEGASCTKCLFVTILSRARVFFATMETSMANKPQGLGMVRFLLIAHLRRSPELCWAFTARLKPCPGTKHQRGDPEISPFPLAM
jgi:hypothetical protein